MSGPSASPEPDQVLADRVEPRGVSRRTFLVSTIALTLAPERTLTLVDSEPMYGLIGKIEALPGQRETLIAVLLEGTADMPGCKSYVVAKDRTAPDSIWVTEVWESRASHEASLSLPSVQAAIAKGRPMIAGFAERFETEPIGGHGLT